jgi:hypothetical protein
MASTARCESLLPLTTAQERVSGGRVLPRALLFRLPECGEEAPRLEGVAHCKQVSGGRAAISWGPVCDWTKRVDLPPHCPHAEHSLHCAVRPTSIKPA